MRAPLALRRKPRRHLAGEGRSRAGRAGRGQGPFATRHPDHGRRLEMGRRVLPWRGLEPTPHRGRRALHLLCARSGDREGVSARPGGLSRPRSWRNDARSAVGRAARRGDPSGSRYPARRHGRDVVRRLRRHARIEGLRRARGTCVRDRQRLRRDGRVSQRCQRAGSRLPLPLEHATAHVGWQGHPCGAPSVCPRLRDAPLPAPSGSFDLFSVSPGWRPSG